MGDEVLQGNTSIGLEYVDATTPAKTTDVIQVSCFVVMTFLWKSHACTRKRYATAYPKLCVYA